MMITSNWRWRNIKKKYMMITSNWRWRNIKKKNKTITSNWRWRNIRKKNKIITSNWRWRNMLKKNLGNNRKMLRDWSLRNNKGLWEIDLRATNQKLWKISWRNPIMKKKKSRLIENQKEWLYLKKERSNLLRIAFHMIISLFCLQS